MFFKRVAKGFNKAKDFGTEYAQFGYATTKFGTQTGVIAGVFFTPGFFILGVQNSQEKSFVGIISDGILTAGFGFGSCALIGAACGSLPLTFPPLALTSFYNRNNMTSPKPGSAPESAPGFALK